MTELVAVDPDPPCRPDRRCDSCREYERLSEGRRVMRRDYEMTQQNPCPACQGVHTFTGTEGVPDWDPKIGAVFQVTCPMTGKLVEIIVPPVEPPPLEDVPVVGAMTDVQCPVCRKANFKVAREEGVGAVVTQWLECSNEGCGYESLRRWNRAAGAAVT
jgi:hypothetical protein